MDRNLYRRIEVCFPIHKKSMKDEINQMIDLHLNDNVQAVIINSKGHNIPVSEGPGQQTIQSQRAIYTMLTSDKKHHFIHDPIH
jgi:polyphosphate kinase